jgi:hypothetical protein
MKLINKNLCYFYDDYDDDNDNEYEIFNLTNVGKNIFQ